jgi:hypothetical protein
MAAVKKTPKKISDLIPDDKNFNKGTEYGNSLIETSLQKFGAGRSILVDKNNRIIAGNKSTEHAAAIGMDDIILVESDGKKLVVVKRTDVDLDSPQGREMALADNATAKNNILFDADLIEAEISDAAISNWGISKENGSYSGSNTEIDVNEFSSEMILKLKYSEKDFTRVKNQLSAIAETPEAAVLHLLKLHKKNA